jgi:hypothetical protein
MMAVLPYFSATGRICATTVGSAAAALPAIKTMAAVSRTPWPGRAILAFNSTQPLRCGGFTPFWADPAW